MYFEKASTMRGARVQTAISRMAKCITESNDNGHTTVLVIKDSISVDEESIATVVTHLQEAGYAVELEWFNGPTDQVDCIKVTWE